MRILLIEDDTGIRFAMETSLSFDGHHTIAVDRGEYALDQIESGVDFDLVLLDLNTNGISAKVFMERLGARPRPPVCVLSASYHMEEEARRIGADYYLRKPFDHADLSAILERSENRPPVLTHNVNSASYPA